MAKKVTQCEACNDQPAEYRFSATDLQGIALWSHIASHCYKAPHTWMVGLDSPVREYKNSSVVPGDSWYEDCIVIED